MTAKTNKQTNFIDDVELKNIYYDAKNPAGFSSVTKLYKAAKLAGYKGTMRMVRNFLHTQPVYTVHYPSRKHFDRVRFQTLGIDFCWMLDLADVQSLSKQNDGINYLLCVIDTFSNFAWVKPIKNRRAATVSTAFNDIILNNNGKRSPHSIFTDKGGEFVNAAFIELLKSKRIKFYQANDPVTKASIAERFIRMLKQRLYKVLSYYKTSQYMDRLSDIVAAYNTSEHRSIKISDVGNCY